MTPDPRPLGIMFVKRDVGGKRKLKLKPGQLVHEQSGGRAIMGSLVL